MVFPAVRWLCSVWVGVGPVGGGVDVLVVGAGMACWVLQAIAPLPRMRVGESDLVVVSDQGPPKRQFLWVV